MDLIKESAPGWQGRTPACGHCFECPPEGFTLLKNENFLKSVRRSTYTCTACGMGSLLCAMCGSKCNEKREIGDLLTEDGHVNYTGYHEDLEGLNEKFMVTLFRSLTPFITPLFNEGSIFILKGG